MKGFRFGSIPLGVCIACALGGFSLPAFSTTMTGGFMADNSTFFSYTGTVTGPDGQAHTIPGFTSTPGNTSYQGRDANVYAAYDAPEADTGSTNNITMFSTNWFSSSDGEDDGSNNPNNNDNGFVQLADLTNASVLSAAGGWTNGTYTTFQLKITGDDSDNLNGAAGNPDRLWDAPNLNGPSTDTYGAFGPYTLLLTAQFAPGAVTEESPGWYSTSADPLSVTGSFSGTFTNTGSKAPGAYSFSLDFIPGNWAGANGLDVGSSYFGASAFTAVPEPQVWGMFGIGVLVIGLAAGMRRRFG